jgi:hypothetical protein
MVKAQQDCLESYLEDCILETNENVADIMARQEIKQMATKINDIAYDIESTYVTLFILTLGIRIS